MIWPVLSFVFGVTLVQHWSRLPYTVEWLSILVLCLVSGLRRFNPARMFLLGTLWASAYGYWHLSDKLDYALEGQDVAVQGYVASLPMVADDRVGFDFVVTRAETGIPQKLRLNWYRSQAAVKAGQSWRLTVRLVRPHGRSNPGGFDYEAWLFANGIGATGYVRPRPEPVEIEGGPSLKRQLASWRQGISDRLDQAIPAGAELGIIKALSLGDQSLISRQQWALFRTTGIVHLMVISGAHIGMVSGLVFLLVRRIWIWLGVLRIAPQTVAALFAWAAAMVYAALAGFSIPVQRSMIMLSIVLWALVRQSNTSMWRIWGMALLVVVLFDPLAVLSSGFWLSFSAVALLLYLFSGRLSREAYWREAGRLHLAMALGLGPLLLLFFQRLSLVAPLANAFAVPVVGMLVTPLALLGAAVSTVSEAAAGLILWPACRLLQALFWLLQRMATWPQASVSAAEPGWPAVVLGALGVLWLLAPRGMPARYLGVFLVLPLVFVDIEKPRTGDWWLMLLDVGQGLSAVLHTETHTLVFDTGAKYSQRSDMGESVLLPYLRSRGVGQIDALLISHDDSDHSGGTTSLLAEMPVARIYSSAPVWAGWANGTFCRVGERWQWDGVEFEILSPGRKVYESDNDNSCVLRVGNRTHSVLLTGDIEKPAEDGLRAEYGARLHSSVLIAPHHGSKSSSSSGFLRQVSPELILIPVGYKNRFGFPHRQVKQRYRKLGIEFIGTAEMGAIQVRSVGAELKLWTARRDGKRYWMD